MAGGVESSSLIVSLIDRVTGPARKASSSIRGIGTAARAVDGTLAGRLSAALDANAKRMDAMRGRMVDAVAYAWALQRALGAPIGAGLRFGTTLEDIGQKASLSGQALDRLGDQIRAIAKATGRAGQETAGTFDALLGLGLGGATDADNVRAALDMMPAINKVATAYRAASDDIARAGQAVFANLKVPAAEVIKAFDAMASSGKAGAFELRDMARYFPSITAMAANLGVKGVKGAADLAAALQVVRQGAGNAEEAATNLINVLQKASTPATQKAFAKVGINFRKEFDKAVAAGKSPIEAMAELTQKALKKKGVKIGDLFEDRQAQLGILALLADMERYRKIRDEAIKASGEVEADFLRRMQTAGAKVDRFLGSVENLNIALGNALLPTLTTITDKLVPMINAIGSLSERFPNVTAGIVGTTAGLVGLRIAVAGARFVFGGLAGGLLTVGLAGAKILRPLAGLLSWGRKAEVAIPAAMAGFSRASQNMERSGRAAQNASAAMVRGMGAARQASDRMIAGMSSAAASAPVTGFVAYGTRAGRAIANGMRAMMAGGTLLSFIPEVIADLQRTAEQRLAASNESAKAWKSFSDSLDASAVGKWWQDVQAQVRGWTLDLASVGTSAITSMIDGMQSMLGDLLAWFRELPAKILAAIGSIDIGSLIKWPSMPSWMSGGGPAPAPAAGSNNRSAGRWGPTGLNRDSTSGLAIGPGRATGGPVRKGTIYPVGEEGPELFSPSQNGQILPNRAYREAARPLPAAASAPVGASVIINAPVSVALNMKVNGLKDVERIAREASRKVADELGSTLNRQLRRQSETAFASSLYGMK
ncbi:phage tail tape measure protein [Ancylobacter terrae]|uniref:phage tail tape measure protein n=1 Tax=Ancylobacter sp. sgz301288 TaxID=3342077 RepID=UPI00385AC211